MMRCRWLRVVRRVMMVCLLFTGLYNILNSLYPSITYLEMTKMYLDIKKGVVKSGTRQNETQGCIQPKFNPFEQDYLRFFHSVEPVKCSDDPDWITVSNELVFITPEAIKRHGNISCDITYYDRINDFRNTDKETVKLTDSSRLKLKWDFLKAKCKANDGKTYSNTHAGIRFVKQFHEKPRTLISGLGLDVLILGFDSISHMTYIRKLKKSYEYFTKTLGGTVLNGYNIVGDGTPQALIPIFTGKTELELPPTLKRQAKKEFVDVYPLVWKDFQQQGYITAWAEDSPHMGTFTYRMVGFNETPTNHYMRPFQITAHYEFEKKNKRLCLGSKRRSTVFMNWFRDFYTMYDKYPKFAFGFHSELSHVDNNLVETADEDLYNLLRFLSEGNYLRNTLLILMSDHGARFSKLRSTLQGKQEERLPFFGFAFPKWFQSKYKEAYDNLVSNSNRLTTPFDIYPTFRDILNYSGPGLGDINSRGISLFKNIPKSRTCQHARIETHWCACLNWQTLAENDTMVNELANHVVKTLNNITQPYRNLCATLKLEKVLRVQMLQPQRNLLKFKKSKDAHGRIVDMSAHTKVSDITYQISLYTSPGSGLFEVTISHNVDTNTFRVDVSSISRVNKYGDAPKCIEEEHEELRKYCYCYN